MSPWHRHPGSVIHPRTETKMSLPHDLESIRDEILERGHLGPQEAREHLRTLCAALGGCGVAELTVGYTGRGDSGEVTEVFREPEEIGLPDDLRRLAEAWAIAVLPEG